MPADAGAVAVTSANALRHAPRGLVDRLVHLPCYAVGGRTAEAARQAGFTDITQGLGDAATLAPRIVAGFSGRLVYLCGRVRFPGFEERLAHSGVRVDAVEIYDTVSIAYDEASACKAMDGRPVAAALLYSAVAAQALRGLCRHEGVRLLLSQSHYFTLSERIAAALGREHAARAHAAAAPSEEALLALLGRHFGPGNGAASSHRPFSPP